MAKDERFKRWYARNLEAQRARRRKYSKANRAAETKRHAAYYEAHKDEIVSKRRNSDFKRKYGISLAERDAMFAAQAGKCAICATESPGPRGLFVDHCHKTGKVRGLLCYRCNTGIAMLGDDVSRLQRAAMYLAVIL